MGILQYRKGKWRKDHCLVVTASKKEWQLLRFLTKMNSLKNVAWHDSNHFGGKKIEKEVAWLEFEITTFMLEVYSANHYTMDALC